jgi:hypothetical protein
LRRNRKEPPCAWNTGFTRCPCGCAHCSADGRSSRNWTWRKLRAADPETVYFPYTQMERGSGSMYFDVRTAINRIALQNLTSKKVEGFYRSRRPIAFSWDRDKSLICLKLTKSVSGGGFAAGSTSEIWFAILVLLVKLETGHTGRRVYNMAISDQPACRVLPCQRTGR